MKRLLAGLVAIFGLALFAPHQAQAAVTCTAVSTTNSEYPYQGHAFYCGAATLTNGQTMAARVHGDGILGNELFRAGVTYYLFDTPAEYAQNFPVSGGNPTPAAGAYGVTKYDTTNVPIFSAVFQHNSSGTLNTHLEYTVNLQVADAGDFLLGYMSNGGVPLPVNARFSASTLFQAQANSDWTTFKQKTPCKTVATNHYQVFNTWADSSSVEATSTYHYICDGTNGTGSNLTSPYTGLTIDEVLEHAWPGIYTSGNCGGVACLTDNVVLNYQGLFQQELAWLMNGNDLSTARSISEVVSDPNGSQVGSTPIHSFQCTEYELRTIQSTAQLPLIADSNRPSGCPAPALQTNCIKRFNQLGYFPDGNVFECEGSGSFTLATSISAEINKLNHTSANTLLKTNLGKYHANIFVFPDQTTFSNVFTAAGITLNGQNITNQNAVTFPSGASLSTGQIWYTIINVSSSAGTNSAKQGFIALHELGHTIDFNIGQPSSTLNTNMQNDWLNIDYVTYPGSVRQPCWVKGQVPSGGSVAATYTGPLVGVVDPIAAGPFCTNGVLTSGLTAMTYAGKKNSYMLQSALDQTGEDKLTYQTDFGAHFGINPGVPFSAGWREHFAQSFAINAEADTGTTSDTMEVDKAIFNGYFSCTAGLGTTGAGSITLAKGYLWYIYNSQTVALPAACNAALPAGWQQITSVTSPR